MSIFGKLYRTLFTREDREVDVAAKLGAAVEDARLAAHQ